MEIVVFASARPVTLEIIAFAPAYCFTSLRTFTGGRPMAAPTAALFKNTSSFCLFNTYIRGGGFSTSSGSPAASHLPLKGKARAKSLAYRSILAVCGFQKGTLIFSAVQTAFPLRGRCRRSRRMRCPNSNTAVTIHSIYRELPLRRGAGRDTAKTPRTISTRVKKLRGARCSGRR